MPRAMRKDKSTNTDKSRFCICGMHSALYCILYVFHIHNKKQKHCISIIG